MKPRILFNHIPRTGGTSLRVILNRVYGQTHVYFINSRNVAASLHEYRQMDTERRSSYRVISGHGAEALRKDIESPFMLTIIREPVSLFMSQYEYLRKSPNSNFLEEVSALKSVEEYIGFALGRGQDNMLTRFLSGDPLSHIQADHAPPSMDEAGEELLEKAKKNLHTYDAVLDLDAFDQGIYALAQRLGWKRIPLYRPLNSSEKKGSSVPGAELIERIKQLQRYDMRLYHYLKEEQIAIDRNPDKHFPGYYIFMTRQRILNALACLR